MSSCALLKTAEKSFGLLTPELLRVARNGKKATLRTAGRSSLTSGGSSSSSTQDDYRPGDGGALKLPARNQSSWAAIISRYTKSGQSREALKVYEEMIEAGYKPSSYTCVAALKACRILRDLKSARKIHVQAMERGVQLDGHLGNMLVDVYAKCGSLVDARLVFDTMPGRDVVSWNAIIAAYAQMEDGDEEALLLYARMQQEGVVCNHRTFVAALKACAGLAATAMAGGNEGGSESLHQRCLEQVRAIHAYVVKTGCESDVFVATTLVDAYSRCRSLAAARLVFERMQHRSVVSWNAMIWGYAQMDQGEEALQLYTRMQQEGVVPNDRTFVSALKACQSMAAAAAVLKVNGACETVVRQESLLDQVRSIHSNILKHRCESDSYVATMLVDIYAKCGSLVDARSVFEKMPHRNVVSWTAMILVYVQMEQGEVALKLYARMQQEGVVPNDRTFVGALKACSSLAVSDEEKQKCLVKVRGIHSQVLQRGLSHSDFVSTMLVTVYMKCGSLVEARTVFDRMPHFNTVAWSTMISGYTEMDQGEAALELYAWGMQQERVVPDAAAFVAALKACSSLVARETRQNADASKAQRVTRKCAEVVRSVHRDIARNKCESDMLVCTMLVDAYAKCGSLGDARQVFDRMPHRDVVCWNVMIMGYAQVDHGGKALELFRQMQQQEKDGTGGVAPNRLTFVSALKACSSQSQSEPPQQQRRLLLLQQVASIHRDVVQQQLESDAVVGNMLVDAYAKCGSLDDARRVFDTMPERNVVSWTAMILGYAQAGECEEALALYTQMQQEGVSPNDRTFVSVLKAFSSLADRDNTLPRAVAAPPQIEVGDDGCRQLRKTRGGHGRGLDQVRSIHRDAAKLGLETELFVATMLVDVYAKCGSLLEARRVFERMSRRSVVSWNTMVSGYAQGGDLAGGEEALQLFARMQREGREGEGTGSSIQPDWLTFMGALKACGSALRLDTGRELHAQIRAGEIPAIATRVPADSSAGFGLDSIDDSASRRASDSLPSLVASSLIDMYAKCGSMSEAQQVLDDLPRSHRDVVTWSALIAGYARHGDSHQVFQSLERMQEEDGVRPELTIFLTLLTVCSHAGLVERGRHYWASMTRDHGLSPALPHYTCMVDLLSRAGLLDEAMAVAQTMPFRPDAAVWRAVLGGCQKWGSVEVGRRAFERAVRQDAQDASVYVLMANIYRGAGMVEEAGQVQAMRTRAEACKEQGRTWCADHSGTAQVFGVHVSL